MPEELAFRFSTKFHGWDITCIGKYTYDVAGLNSTGTRL